jgi:hypothetical protein
MLPAVVWARGRAQIALREDRRRKQKQKTAFATDRQTRSTFHDPGAHAA